VIALKYKGDASKDYSAGLVDDGGVIVGRQNATVCAGYFSGIEQSGEVEAGCGDALRAVRYDVSI